MQLKMAGHPCQPQAHGVRVESTRTTRMSPQDQEVKQKRHASRRSYRPAPSSKTDGLPVYRTVGVTQAEGRGSWEDNPG